MRSGAPTQVKAARSCGSRSCCQRAPRSAAVEPLRRLDYAHPKIVGQVPPEFQNDPHYREHPEDWIETDYTATPTVKTERLSEKQQHSEAEVLLGSGAQFRIKSVTRARAGSFKAYRSDCERGRCDRRRDGVHRRRVQRRREQRRAGRSGVMPTKTPSVPPPDVDKFAWDSWTLVTPKPKKKQPIALDWHDFLFLELDVGPRGGCSHEEAGWRERCGDEGRSGGGVRGRMASLKEKYPRVAENYARDSGTEMGSIEAHTKDVGREWEKQLSPDELAEMSKRFGSDVEALMASAIPLHDIGKPDAIAAGEKDEQHEHTIPILRDVLTQEGFSPKEVALATELLNHDLIGPLLRGYEGVKGSHTPEQVAAELEAKAQKVGIDVADFAKLQLAFYQADASAYPYVTQFMEQEPSGKWTFAGKKRLAPIVALTKRKPQDLSARYDLELGPRGGCSTRNPAGGNAAVTKEAGRRSRGATRRKRASRARTCCASLTPLMIGWSMTCWGCPNRRCAIWPSRWCSTPTGKNTRSRFRRKVAAGKTTTSCRKAMTSMSRRCGPSAVGICDGT